MFPGDDIAMKTLIGATILKSGHPYIWAMLPQAHNACIVPCRDLRHQHDSIGVCGIFKNYLEQSSVLSNTCIHALLVTQCDIACAPVPEHF